MRRIALSLFLLLVATAAGYTVYWFHLAHRLEAGIGPWAQSQRARGYTLRWEGVAVEGYPVAFRLRFRRAAASSDNLLPLAIAAPTLLAEARPWDLQRWRVSAPEGVSAEAPSEGDGLTAGALDGWATLGRDGGTAIDLTLRDVAGTGLAAGIAVASAEAQLAIPDRPPASHRDAALGAALRLAKLALPAPVPPFGGTIEALSLAWTIKGGLPQGRLRDALAAWRQEGGTVELTEGSLRWGTLAINANGTLALDDGLQPIGALTAEIEDHNAIIDAAAANGNLRADDARLVKTFLGLLAKPDADGKKRLKLPLSLQNDRVYLGPVQIAALPRFTWE